MQLRIPIHLSIEDRWIGASSGNLATRRISGFELRRELQIFVRSRVGEVRDLGRVGRLYPSSAKKKGRRLTPLDTWLDARG